MTGTTNPRTLRIALALRGGVSLSVWIGGAVREIERLRTEVREPTPSTALARIAKLLHFEKVELDVVSGASAGGLNAVLLGRAMVAGVSMDSLREIWLNDAAIAHLLHRSSSTVPLSLLDGDYFLEKLEGQIAKLGADDPSANGQAAAPAPIDRLDVLLSVTSIVANVIEATNDPAAPVVDHHIDGVIHLRHRNDGYSDFTSKDSAHHLALAARSTASFPVAFQPVPIDKDELKGAIEFRPQRPEPLMLFDGGVVDNMPVDKAVRAITTAPADGPVARILLYLHPSPGAPDTRAAAREAAARAALAQGVRPMDVLQSATKALRSKSLADDLHELDAHNARVEGQLRDRDRLLLPYLNLAAPLPGAAAGAIGDLDAEQIVDLLIAPWDHVSFATTPVESLALLSGRQTRFLQDLRSAIARLLGEHAARAAALQLCVPAMARASIRPWGPLIRSTSLLIEWCRTLEEQGCNVGSTKLAIAKVREDAIRRAADLNVKTLARLQHVVYIDEFEALATEVVCTRLALCRPYVGQVAAAWDEVGSLAAEIPTQPALSGLPAKPPGWVLAPLLAARMAVCAPSAAKGLELLDSIDNILLPQHRGRPSGSQDKIRYLTLSGSADTPLRDNFEWAAAVTPPILSLKSLRTMPVNEKNKQRAGIDPASKLAGNQLHNFAAFLARSWRANDWMWGQVDAASIIVDLLLAWDDSPWNADEVAEEIRVLLCEQPLPPSEAPAGWSAEVKEAGTRLWEGAESHVRAELAMRSPTSELPEVTRSLLLWRRHIEIVATELARDSADNPVGVSPCGTLEDTMRSWDKSSRRLSDKWGNSATAALGMRALFVGWRTLFARVGAPLSWIRVGLSPILVPIVGLILCRRRAPCAIAIFVLGCVVPRVHDHNGGRFAVVALTLASSAAWLWLTRVSDIDNGAIRKRWKLFEPWAVATLVATALVVAEACVINQSPFDRIVPGHTGLASYVAPGAAIALATFITWHWANWYWRVPVVLAHTGIVCSWVYLGSNTADVHRWYGAFGPMLGEIASFWWCIVALALVSTALGTRVDLARTPADNRI